MTAILVGPQRPARNSATLVTQYSCFHDIPLEPLYSGKLFWWLNRELQSGQLQEGVEVVLIHSGGIFPDSNPQ